MAEQKNYLARKKVNVLAKNTRENALLDGLRSDPINRMRGYVASSMSHVPYRNPINAPEISLGDVARQAIAFSPGIGDLQSGAEAIDYAQQGRPVMAGMAGLGALPFVPAIAGISSGKGAKTADDALKAAGKTYDAISPDKQSLLWKTIDVHGNGRRIEHISPDGKSAVVQQLLPNGKIVYYPAEINSEIGVVFPDMRRQLASLEEAKNNIKGMRISAKSKLRNSELYGDIPNTWTGDSKKAAKMLIDNGIPIHRFYGSTQSKSKYIELTDGTKIRLSDHDLPPKYEGSDIDFRYGGDFSIVIDNLKARED